MKKEIKGYMNFKPIEFYNIFGFSTDISANEMMVLQWMIDFAGYLNDNKENQIQIHEGEAYYWFDYLKIHDDMPYIFKTFKDKEVKEKSKRTRVHRVISKLIELGAIVPREAKHNRGECKTRFAFTEKTIRYKRGNSSINTFLQKCSKPIYKNVESLSTKMSHNSIVNNSEVNNSSTLGSTTFLTQLFSKLETTYLQQFQQQPSKTWIANQQKKYTQEQIEDVFMRVEAYCVEHTGYPKKRKNLGRVFTQFAKDLKKKTVDVPAYVIDGFTNFFKSKGIDLDASNTANTTKQKMHQVVKKVSEHYGTKMDAKKVAKFLALVNKELWFESKTGLYNVAYLLNKTAEAIATLPKKKKEVTRAKSLQVNKFVSTFAEEVKLDKHLDLERKFARHKIRESLAFLVSALGVANFSSIEQVKNIYSKFLDAYINGNYDTKQEALKHILTKK